MADPIVTPQAPRLLAASSTRHGWLQYVPTALVLLVLGGFALYGHHTGWSLPKFSELIGRGQQESDDWCAEHAVPESICVECNPKQFPAPRRFGWCTTHEIHECPLDHPAVAQVAHVPKIASAELERVRLALALKERPTNSQRCKLHERRIQVASTDVLDKMGVHYSYPVSDQLQKPLVEAVTASGELEYEQPSVAPVAVLATGRVWKLTEQARQGATVKQGDVLALVEAPEVGKVKSDLMQALAQLELKERLYESTKDLAAMGLKQKNELREAESALREAQLSMIRAQQMLLNLGLPVEVEALRKLSPQELAARMQLLGLPESLAKSLDPALTSTNLLPVKAPRAGTIIAVKVAAGEVVDPAKTLFTIADTSRLWLHLHVRLEDVSFLRARTDSSRAPGQTVLFRPDGGGAEVAGELTWISTEVDEKTRTVQARALVANPEAKLRAHTFGKARVVLRVEQQAVVVPSEAVHWDGVCSIVFVRDKDWFKSDTSKVFHVRNVRLGVKDGDSTEIIAGLIPGEIIATRNSAALRAELLKGQLGEC